MSSIQIFNNSEFGEIRAVRIDGQAWFVGKDVAEALGYTDTDQAIRNHVEEEDKLTRRFNGSGQNRNMTIINESGLYSLILGSKLPKAKEFKHWILDEVIPSLRRDDNPTHYVENIDNSRDYSTNSNLQVFNNSEFGEIRAIDIEGEPWFVGKDVAEALGYQNTRDALGKHVFEEDKNTVAIRDGIPGNPNTTIINESGLYSLIMSSQLPKAREFKHWVTSEVLPDIRTHGMYAASELMEDPAFLVEVALRYKAERDAKNAAIAALDDEIGAHAETRTAKERLQLEAELNAPKVILADAITVTDDTILIRELAKILKGNGIDIGEKRLFEKLREEGYLIKKQGSDQNAPTQMAMELGLFMVNEKIVQQSNGRMILCKTTRVTGKGQQYFVNRFLGEKNLKEAR